MPTPRPLPPITPGLTRLDLRHCGLTQLPEAVLALGDTLQVLDVSDNQLESLPRDLHRLHRLQVIFCSYNRFTSLPAVLGDCPALEIVGFRGNQIADLPAASLPPRLRWLILTDNRLQALPAELGRRPRLQKLMLAGNLLAGLPGTLGDCQALELARLSANAFTDLHAALPDGLLALPRLAWLAVNGNPFNADDEAAAAAQAGPGLRAVDWSALRCGELLGEGASGLIHAAAWQEGHGDGDVPDGVGPEAGLALKFFKGGITSDGRPQSERAACLRAGRHPHLVGLLGWLQGHPEGREALVLRRIPAGYRNLAGPPSFETCTRDVYPDDLALTRAQADTVLAGVRDALAHLHARGVMHGDLYAHNLLIDTQGRPLLGDLGAATLLPLREPAVADALRRMDLRALAVLEQELRSLAGPDAGSDADAEPASPSPVSRP